MEISSIFSNSSTTSSGLPVSNKDLDKDAFMQLLVAQLQNQDPMEPKDNSEQISQLANFSSLEQMTQLNEGVLSLILLNQGNAQVSQLAQGSTLIGHEVSWEGPDGSSGTGVVESLEVADGLVVAKIGSQQVPLIDVTAVSGPKPPAPSED